METIYKRNLTKKSFKKLHEDINLTQIYILKQH